MIDPDGDEASAKVAIGRVGPVVRVALAKVIRAVVSNDPAITGQVLASNLDAFIKARE